MYRYDGYDCCFSTRYVEEETPLMKKLYITQIQSSDEGDYRCQATRGSFRAAKTVRITIFRKYPPYLLDTQF